MNTPNDKIEKIHSRIYHNRLDQNKDLSKWTFISTKDIRPAIVPKIKELLETGNIVTGGYYTTAVKGYHEYYILYRKKTKTS